MHQYRIAWECDKKMSGIDSWIPRISLDDEAICLALYTPVATFVYIRFRDIRWTYFHHDYDCFGPYYDY